MKIRGRLKIAWGGEEVDEPIRRVDWSPTGLTGDDRAIDILKLLEKGWGGLPIPGQHPTTPVLERPLTDPYLTMLMAREIFMNPIFSDVPELDRPPNPHRPIMDGFWPIEDWPKERSSSVVVELTAVRPLPQNLINESALRALDLGFDPEIVRELYGGSQVP